jgi:hypothetical protein
MPEVVPRGENGNQQISTASPLSNSWLNDQSTGSFLPNGSSDTRGEILSAGHTFNKRVTRTGEENRANNTTNQDFDVVLSVPPPRYRKQDVAAEYHKPSGDNYMQLAEMYIYIYTHIYIYIYTYVATFMFNPSDL